MGQAMGLFTDVEPERVEVVTTNPELTEDGIGRRLTDSSASEDLSTFEVVFALYLRSEQLPSVRNTLQETQVNTEETQRLSSILTDSLAKITNNATVIAKE